MKRLVVIPSDPIDAYIAEGFSWDFLERYYNPQIYFDEVYCLSPWKCEKQNYGTLKFIKSHPIFFHRIIKKINPLVVRAYGGYYCADWSVYSKVTDIPVIVSVHDTRSSLIYDGVKYADKVICMTKAVEEAVCNKLHISKEKTVIMPNRVDHKVFSKKKCPDKFTEFNNRYGSGKHILHVGRKAEEKNLDTVIKALKYLPSDYSLLCIGRGKEDYYKKIAKDEKVINRCFFLESVNHEELPYFYSWCDCFCTPSRSEGFGIVFIEALACELTIVTSNIPPMNEFLVNNYNAILVDKYENPEDIAAAIQRACKKDEYTKKLALNGLKTIEQFDNDFIDSKEVEIYKEVISMGAKNERPKEISIVRTNIKRW